MSRITPKCITELSKCEVFVFGSNLEGQHCGGAARIAYEKFGAEWGVGSGPTGKCYAIPTMHGGIDKIKPYVDQFVEYARSHPNNRFYVTRVGCGIAGFSDEDMAPLFSEAWRLLNVCMPIKWVSIIDKDMFIDAYFFGITPPEVEIKIPEAITEEDLRNLCEEYKYVIGTGLITPLPKIRIRYVIDRNKFGYAEFGKFFMRENGDLYVWTFDKTQAAKHNQQMVEEIFEDECRWLKARGYSFIRGIFAGVETSFTDCHGKQIYTGDVLRIWTAPNDEYHSLLAFGTLGSNGRFSGFSARYCCPLDNHYMSPDMWHHVERAGTVFFQLDWNDNNDDNITKRCFGFNGFPRPNFSNEENRVLAKFTPNFYKELWKYQTLEMLGGEFNF